MNLNPSTTKVKGKKVSFIVTHDLWNKKLNALMDAFDLGMSGVTGDRRTERYTWTTTTPITSGYIRKMKNGLKKVLEENNRRVVHIYREKA